MISSWWRLTHSAHPTSKNRSGNLSIVPECIRRASFSTRLAAFSIVTRSGSSGRGDGARATGEVLIRTLWLSPSGSHSYAATGLVRDSAECLGRVFG
jgi:hypothetical protein